LVQVGHVPTIFTTPGRLTVIFVPFSRLPVALAVPIVWPPSPSAFVGVGHVDRLCITVLGRSSRRPLRAISFTHPSGVRDPLSPSTALGVGHVECDPVEALANVRGVDRESWEISAPAGVAFSFQISANSVEPTVASRSRNLFSQYHRGPDGTDEAMKVGPQVPWIVSAGAFACDRERLAGARSCPDGAVVWPSGEAEGVAPPADSGEEVALGKASEVQRLNIDN
jgi:hypothetical protein